MRRREFTLLGCLAVGWPLAARAQQPAKIARIGWMSRGNACAPDANMNAFRQGMRELSVQRLAMLKQLVPSFSRVAILWRPGTLGEATVQKLQKQISASPDGAGFRAQVVAATGPADFDAAFSAMKQEGAETLIVL